MRSLPWWSYWVGGFFVLLLFGVLLGYRWFTQPIVFVVDHPVIKSVRVGNQGLLGRLLQSLGSRFGQHFVFEIVADPQDWKIQTEKRNGELFTTRSLSVKPGWPYSTVFLHLDPDFVRSIGQAQLEEDMEYHVALGVFMANRMSVGESFSRDDYQNLIQPFGEELKQHRVFRLEESL